MGWPNEAILNNDYEIKEENDLVLHGENSKKMVDFYCNKVKRGDLAVVWRNSSICTMEVHSSRFLPTIRKAVYSIIDLIRVAKAHGINDCMLLGFALPKLMCKRCIVKVSVSVCSQHTHVRNLDATMKNYVYQILKKS